MAQSRELAKSYDPKEAEDRIYRFWMDGGTFHAEINPEKKPYTIVMPPPNITGQLHLGHALDATWQDILIRWRRMQGYEALWLPGTDHASIATEARIVENMAQEGLTKEDIGREAFLERAWEWKKTYGGQINKQIQKLGASCDWERERFTLDEGCSKAVREVFVRLYEKGLIYRGERMINWCPHCRTSISDAEVEFQETNGFFYHLRYRVEGTDESLQLATTRPETLLGDTAVAVHPEDERYRAYVGKNVILPIVGRIIPVVADEYVQRDFGTGVVKITPAHDPNDFEVGLRHNLEVITVTTEDGRMNELAGKYAGLTIAECREQIVKDLQAAGDLVKIEPITHNVGTCYRCGTVIEPRVSLQWFVSMKPLAGPAVEAVQSGKINFVPKRFEKPYFHWLENIRDWCISRQLWWGHRIPAWYCDECGETVVAREDPRVCPKCGGHLTQDEDTLDTWFSSALWPFSTMGWPDDTPEMRYFFPTDTLVTGYDIITFWVMRMIFSSLEYTGKEPFHTVLIHGLVRDEKGRKMSKSLGNGVDPLKVIERYGADALRFALVTGNSPGNDIRFMSEKLEAARNFTNKLWNAARFVRMNLGDEDVPLTLPETLALEDKWILSRFNTLVKQVSENLEKFELGLAMQKVYDFIWDSYCDWFIELCKPRLRGEDAPNARRVLCYVMRGMLALLHPFMPFITEEIWQSLPHEGETLMRAPWPEYSQKLNFAGEEREMERIMQAVRAVRNRRAEMRVPPSRKTEMTVETSFPETFSKGASVLMQLAGASKVTVGSGAALKNAVNIVTPDATVFIPLDELVDREAEKERLRREAEAVQKQLAAVRARLANLSFTEKAPADVVNTAREQEKRLSEKLALLQKSGEAL